MVIVLAIYIITNFYILLYSKMNVLYYTGLFSVFLNPLFIYPLARSLNYLLFYLKYHILSILGTEIRYYPIFSVSKY